MARDKKDEQEKYNSTFAKRLRKLLERKEVSQSKLAEYVGVTRQAISAYSLGTSVPDIDKFEKIADFFEVSTDYLLGRTDSTPISMEYREICEQLHISECALLNILGLQSSRPNLDIVEDYALMDASTEKLDRVFSLLLEAVNWQGVTLNLLNALKADHEENSPRLNSEGEEKSVMPQFSETEKQILRKLRNDGYVLLEPHHKKSFYMERVQYLFNFGLKEIFNEEKDFLNGYEDLPLDGPYLRG